MATAYKILGQQAPSTAYPSNPATTDLYTVGAATSTVVSTISITNTTSTAANAYIWIRQAGGAASTANSLLTGASIPANSVTAITIGITLAATDKITVASGTANALAYQAFGSEIS